MDAKEIKEGINKVPDNVLEEMSHSEFNTKNISGGKIGEKGMKAIKVLGVLSLLGGTAATGILLGRKSVDDDKLTSENDDKYNNGFKTGMALWHTDFGDKNKGKPEVELDKIHSNEQIRIRSNLRSIDKINLT